MTQIIQFIPKHEISANQNLDDFINFAHNELTLWSDLRGFTWTADRWQTTHTGIRFINFENKDLPPKSRSQPIHLMHPSFIEFAKAFLRYKHTLHPTKGISRDIAALRLIEFSLRQNMATPDITKFDQRHWEIIVCTLESSTIRQSLCNIVHSILKSLSDLFIIQVDPRFWRHPYLGARSYDYLNGSQAPAEVKAQKAPDQDALLAIAEVFSRGAYEVQIDNDVMVTCITALLLSAPMRIGETLRFRIDCLRDDHDKNGEIQYYLVYWVPKTKEFARKPIPKTLINITTDAINRLVKITDEGRSLARYMETNPSRFYRHANCPNVQDNEPLSVKQVMQALGFTDRTCCQSLIHRLTGSWSLSGFTLDSLWKLILIEHKATNPYFPYQEPHQGSTNPPLKMSESLLCLRRNQLRLRSTASPVLLAPFDPSFYGKRLDTGNAAAESINFFAYHGYKAFKLKSHSIRHLINRLARSSGISLDLITEWSSRATSRQTRTYLNDDPLTFVAKGADILGTVQKNEPLQPVTEEHAEKYGHGPFHRSRYGICRRSWRAGPCNKFADCLNCSELLMCKGDRLATDTIQHDLDSLRQTYDAAQQAISDGERSASRWTLVTAAQIKQITNLLSILNDISIPDGSPIEIEGRDFSHEQTIVSEKAEAAAIRLPDKQMLGITYGDDLLACLELLRSTDNA